MSPAGTERLEWVLDVSLAPRVWFIVSRLRFAASARLSLLLLAHFSAFCISVVRVRQS